MSITLDDLNKMAAAYELPDGVDIVPVLFHTNTANRLEKGKVPQLRFAENKPVIFIVGADHHQVLYAVKDGTVIKYEPPRETILDQGRHTEAPQLNAV